MMKFSWYELTILVFFSESMQLTMHAHAPNARPGALVTLENRVTVLPFVC